MDALIASFGLVAVAEIGDKTQLLALLLAARYRQRAPAIIAGIFVATVANHALAAALGGWAAARVSPEVLRWVLGVAFLGFAVWALVPDALDDHHRVPRFGAFVTTLLVFFVAEMGDKTQLATAALGARYQSLVMVTLGTTLGMLAANVPAVLVGDRLGHRLSLSVVRYLAAALFAVFGVLVLADLGPDGLSAGVR